MSYWWLQVGTVLPHINNSRCLWVILIKVTGDILRYLMNIHTRSIPMKWRRMEAKHGVRNYSNAAGFVWWCDQMAWYQIIIMTDVGAYTVALFRLIGNVMYFAHATKQSNKESNYWLAGWRWMRNRAPLFLADVPGYWSTITTVEQCQLSTAAALTNCYNSVIACSDHINNQLWPTV